MIEGSKDGYPELEEKKAIHLQGAGTGRGRKFNKTIDQGLEHPLRIWKQRWQAKGEKILNGDECIHAL